MKICVIAPLVGVGLFGLSPATTSNAVQYNPKELQVDQNVPWQKSKGKPSGKTISSTNPSASQTPRKSAPKSPGKIEYPNLVSYVPEADSAKPGKNKHGNVITQETAATSHGKFLPDGSPIRAKVNLPKHEGRKPILSANPGASVSPARATTNVKVQEADRLALKKSTSTSKKSKDMVLKGQKIHQN